MNKKSISAVIALAITLSNTVSMNVVTNAEDYGGTLAIGETVKFDFGAGEVAEGYIGVEASRDYTQDAATENGLTYGFLGLGENGYNVSLKTDGFTMLKGSQITLANGGNDSAVNANEDCVYALNSFLVDETKSYDMGDAVMPVRFALKSDGHSYYKVTATVSCADTSKPAEVSLFNEKRHPIITGEELSAGETKTVTFTANVMDVQYKTSSPTKYEDDMLNIIVLGENAGLASLEVTRLDPADAPTTIWVCSDSTGCDQMSYMPYYPLQNYSGVGQGISKYLTEMTVSNQGEGGLGTADRIHFNSAVEQMRAGDYLYVEYGHNESSPDSYKANLEKYYDATVEKKANLIIVGPIDRTQRARWDGTQWTSSLGEYSQAGKEFVEEKIAAGADNVAFVDLNAPWIEFLNAETDRIAQRRYELGIDAQKTIDPAAMHYYYTYNKSGATDGSHINDYGTEQAAYIFAQGVKKVVAAGSEADATESAKLQAQVLAPIAEDVNDNTPLFISDEVIAAGWAPNSLYPAHFTERVEYPYSLNIRDITFNEDGTLKDAEVYVIQDITNYATVYVTAYDENNAVLGTIAGSGENGRIDNTADTSGAVKRLVFDSDIVPHHFSAVMYYCDENNERLTEEGKNEAVSPKFESVKEVNVLLDEDFESYTDVPAGENMSCWESYGSMERTSTKQIESNGNVYTNLTASGGNSAMFWEDLTGTAQSGIYEVSLRFRYNSGYGAFGLGNSASGYLYTNILTMDGTEMKIGDTVIGTGNSAEWTDAKFLLDHNTGEVTGNIGGYDIVSSTLMPDANEINKFFASAASKQTIDVDVDDILIREVETYTFPSVSTEDPSDMAAETSLMFGGETVAAEIFNKKGDSYKTGTQTFNYSHMNEDKSANLYINMNVAVSEDGNAVYKIGKGGGGQVASDYYAIEFKAADTAGVSTTESDTSVISEISLIPGKWYNVYVKMDKNTGIGTVMLNDITSGKLIADSQSDALNCTFDSEKIHTNLNYHGWVTDNGQVYIANAYLYNKPMNITADNANVTVTAKDGVLYAGHIGDIILSLLDGYEIGSAVLGDKSASKNDDGTWTIENVLIADTEQIIHITRTSSITDIVDFDVTAEKELVKYTTGMDTTVQLAIENATDPAGLPVQFDESNVVWSCDAEGVSVENGTVTIGEEFGLDRNSIKNIEVKATLNDITKSCMLTVYSYAFYEPVNDGKTSASWDGTIVEIDGKYALRFADGYSDAVTNLLTLPEKVTLGSEKLTISYSNYVLDKGASQRRTLDFIDSNGNSILEMPITYNWNDIKVGEATLSGAAPVEQWTDISIVINTDGTGEVICNDSSIDISIKEGAADIAAIQFYSTAPDRLLALTDFVIMLGENNEPTATPTVAPTVTPTAEPTAIPTAAPTVTPTAEPTAMPTATPTVAPTDEPEKVLPQLISAVMENGNISVSVDYDITQNVSVIVAGYKDNRLIRVRMIEELTESVYFGEESEYDSIKVFLWDMNNMMPLSQYFTVK